MHALRANARFHRHMFEVGREVLEPDACAGAARAWAAGAAGRAGEGSGGQAARQNDGHFYTPTPDGTVAEIEIALTRPLAAMPDKGYAAGPLKSCQDFFNALLGSADMLDNAYRVTKNSCDTGEHQGNVSH